MAARVIALVCLCLAFIANAKPVEEELPRLKQVVDQLEKVVQGIRPQLLGGGVEGDMIFPPGVNPKANTRGVAIYGNKQWPGNVIPYDMSAITDSNDQKIIVAAMNQLMYDVATSVSGTTDREACVYFRQRQTSDKVWFKIQYGDGCSAHVGYMTSQQPVMTLQKNSGPYQEGCFYASVIQHELMHVLGFYHEQSRPDRDNYLTINLNNVDSNMAHNFNKYAWGSSVLNQGTGYDYKSIMHYGETAFSMNGKPTMVPRQSGVTIGEADELSATDIAEVRHYYNCQA